VKLRLIEEGTAQEFKRCVLVYLKSKAAMSYRDIWIVPRQSFSLRKDESVCSGTLSYLLA
jgi:hypothetical protein